MPKNSDKWQKAGMIFILLIIIAGIVLSIQYLVQFYNGTSEHPLRMKVGEGTSYEFDIYTDETIDIYMYVNNGGTEITKYYRFDMIGVERLDTFTYNLTGRMRTWNSIEKEWFADTNEGQHDHPTQWAMIKNGIMNITIGMPFIPAFPKDFTIGKMKETIETDPVFDHMGESSVDTITYYINMGGNIVRMVAKYNENNTIQSADGYIGDTKVMVVQRKMAWEIPNNRVPNGNISIAYSEYNENEFRLSANYTPSDDEDIIIGYEWYLNTTKIGTGSKITDYNFTKEGTYYVSLKVTDVNGDVKWFQTMFSIEHGKKNYTGVIVTIVILVIVVPLIYFKFFRKPTIKKTSGIVKKVGKKSVPAKAASRNRT